MAYKNINKYFSFADMAIQRNMDKNRSLIFLKKIDQTIDWYPIETLLKNFISQEKRTEEKELILLCFCSNACCCRNGFKSNPILNLKARSMIESLLNPF